MKKRFYDVNPQERKRLLRDFCEMIAGLGDAKNAEKFLRDLLTPSEIIMISRRVEIAKMLLVGFSYEDIRKKIKVGYSTIGAVNRWLFSGFGGYINELKKAKNQEQRKNIFPKNEWEAMKKKYPVHFLLFNLLDNYEKYKKSKSEKEK